MPGRPQLTPSLSLLDSMHTLRVSSVPPASMALAAVFGREEYEANVGED